MKKRERERERERQREIEREREREGEKERLDEEQTRVSERVKETPCRGLPGTRRKGIVLRTRSCRTSAIQSRALKLATFSSSSTQNRGF